MNLAVRRAVPDDAPALTGLMEAVYGDFGEETPPPARVEAFFREALAPGGGLDALVAEDDEGPCGLLTLALVPTTQGLGHFAWLDDFHVRADRRGRGIGTRLLAAAREHAAQRGAGEIRLSADEVGRLPRLYESAGFRRNGLSLFGLSLVDARGDA